MASNSKHTDWILETIDHLRKRKARPDLERICHVVKRRYGLSAVETEAKLEKLVDSEIVIKVDYKGSTSYRNAAKWRKSMLGCAVLNSTTISIKILEAILELSRMHVKENTVKQTQDGEMKEDLPEDIELNARIFATETGVSLDNINTWLKEHCEGFDNLKSPLTVVLKREIDAGRVKRLQSCHYVIASAQMDEIIDGVIKPLKSSKMTENKPAESLNTSQSSFASTSATDEGTSSNCADDPKTSSQTSDKKPTLISSPPQPARRGRPPKHKLTGLSSQSTSSSSTTAAIPGTSKLKRMLTSEFPGQAEDVSEQKPPKKMETRKGSSAGDPACNFCKLSSLSNPAGLPEALLTCKDCAVKAHPTCMNYSHFLASRAYRGPWQCMNCKTCCVCQDPGHHDQMLFCDGCDKGYHMNCHNPSISKKPSGKWECSACRLENLSLQRSEFMSRQGHHHAVSHESAPPTPAESPVPSHLISSGDLHMITKPWNVGDTKYPDASQWSVEDVVVYLTEAGFTEEAKLFGEQEIDGVALLLLKRTDVLKGLNLKLGPALKLNRHIQGLQAACQSKTQE